MYIFATFFLLKTFRNKIGKLCEFIIAYSMGTINDFLVRIGVVEEVFSKNNAVKETKCCEMLLGVGLFKFK